MIIETRDTDMGVEVVINGTSVPQRDVDVETDGTVRLTHHDLRIDQLGALRPEQFPRRLCISFLGDSGRLAEHFECEVTRSGDRWTPTAICDLWLGWRSPWNAQEYFDSLVEAVTTTCPANAEIAELYQTTDALGLLLRFEGGPGEELSQTLSDLSALLEQAERRAAELLDARLTRRPFAAYFELPEEFAAPAMQYLAYFSEFLLDLGLRADTETRSTGRQLLFAVHPHDQRVALERIAQALLVFLQLPADPKTWSIEPGSESIAALRVQGLSATVEHLRAQLTLAHATMAAQRMIIGNLQDESERLGDLLRDSLKVLVVSGGGEDEPIPMLGGVLEVKDLEGSWYKIRLPQILRWILPKRTDRQEDETPA